MSNKPCASKALRDRELACLDDVAARIRSADPTPNGYEKINHCGVMRIRFRFVLMAKVNGLEELWTI
jgi:hypothetical protein